MARIALEHPVAELAAHRQDAPEEAGVGQLLQLQEARQPELVLHDAVLHARFLRGAVDVERGRERRRHRLFAVDVLAGRDRLLDELRPQLRGSGVEEHRVRPVRQRLPEIRRPALDAMRPGEFPQLVCVAARQYRIGHEPCAVGEAHAPFLADLENGAHEVLVRAHASRHPMHDDPDATFTHDRYSELTG